MPHIVVGLFNSASEAQFTADRLVAGGFPREALSLATQQTLRAQHLPALADAPDSSGGLVQFFTDLFATDDCPHPEEAHAYVAACHPDSAVLTVAAPTAEDAGRARAVLHLNGALDVYKQPAPVARPAPAAARPDDGIDLLGPLARVRDDDELDDNGLTGR